jgi:hypothetical protein
MIGLFVRVISHQPAVLFLSEQISHQQSASSTFLSEQTSHQQPGRQYFFPQNKSAPAISRQPNE